MYTILIQAHYFLVTEATKVYNLINISFITAINFFKSARGLCNVQRNIGRIILEYFIK